MSHHFISIYLILYNCITDSYLRLVVCGMSVGIEGYKQFNYDNYIISSPALTLLDSLQINRLVRKNLKLMIALFIISVLVFLYMVYVLIKPEKF